MRISQVIFFGLVTWFVSATTFAQDEDKAAADASEKVCVNSRTVRNFDALTDEYVYVEAQSKKYYLFTMKNRCIGLRHAQGIAISDTTSRVCSGGFGEIKYRDMSRNLTSCRIDKIQVVESKDEAKAIVEQLEKNDD